MKYEMIPEFIVFSCLVSKSEAFDWRLLIATNLKSNDSSKFLNYEKLNHLKIIVTKEIKLDFNWRKIAKI